MKPSDRRILFIIPSLIRAGAETQLVMLINLLAPRFAEVHLLVLGEPYDLEERLHENIRLHKFKKSGFFNWRAIRFARRLVKTAAIDWVHCSLNYAVLHGWLALVGLRQKPKIMAIVHSTMSSSLKFEWAEKLIYIRILKRCTLVIFVCELQRDFWVRRAPALADNSRVIYNGIDIDHFNPANCRNEARQLRNALGLKPESFVIACIAGFRPEKNHLNLLLALKVLSDDVHLVLAGDGPLRQQIEETISEQGLGRRVHLLGQISDVRPLLAAADITVLPSRTETFSIAMLESMAMETPVVGSDIGGMREAVIDGETGWLLPAVSAPEIARVLLHVRENLTDQIPNSARQLVVERFSEDLMAEQYEEALAG